MRVNRTVGAMVGKAEKEQNKEGTEQRRDYREKECRLGQQKYGKLSVIKTVKYELYKKTNI